MCGEIEARRCELVFSAPFSARAAATKYLALHLSARQPALLWRPDPRVHHLEQAQLRQNLIHHLAQHDARLRQTQARQEEQHLPNRHEPT
jgi:hypothetical protein